MDAKTVAKEVCRQYKEQTGKDLSEVRLQKLMHFVQRESFIEKRKPLFDALALS